MTSSALLKLMSSPLSNWFAVGSVPPAQRPRGN
jgi:hypothetical protein